MKYIKLNSSTLHLTIYNNNNQTLLKIILIIGTLIQSECKLIVKNSLLYKVDRKINNSNKLIKIIININILYHNQTHKLHLNYYIISHQTHNNTTISIAIIILELM